MKSLKAKFRKSDAHEWSKNDDRLLQAVEHGEVDKVTSLLAKKGVNAVKLDSEGKSALHLAAAKGQAECLGVILSHGVDVTVLDVSGCTALHLAAKNNHQECAKKLIQSKCTIEGGDSSGKTALHYAAACSSAPIVQLLCEQNCPVNVKDAEGCTPLLLCSQNTHEEVCRCLIDHGADINACDKNGRTAVMMACESSSLKTAEILIQKGADLRLVDTLGHDALHYSKLSGNAEIKNLLQAALGKFSLESDTKTTQLNQHDQVSRLNAERSTTPKKRKAPPPPISPPQSCDYSSPPFMTPTQTPPSGGDLSFTEFHIKEEQKSIALKEQIGELHKEKVLLLETIQDLNTILNQQQAEQNGPEEQNVIATLQAQITSLSLENKKLTHKLKRTQARHSDEENNDSSCHSSFDSNASYHSTKADFQQSLEVHEASETEAKGNSRKSSLKNDSASVKQDDDEKMVVGSEEEIKQLQVAVQNIQIQLQQSEVEKQNLQDKLLSMTSENVQQCSQEVSENCSDILEQKLKETQRKYEEATEEVLSLRAQMKLESITSAEKNSISNVQELKCLYEEQINELKGELSKSLEEQERDKNIIKELEQKLDSLDTRVPVEEYEDVKNSCSMLVENINKEKALLIDKYREAQEEIKLLQEALKGTVPVEAAATDFEEMKAEMNQTIDGLQKHLLELSHSYSDAKSELTIVKNKLSTYEKETVSSEQRDKDYVTIEHHERIVLDFAHNIEEMKEKLLETEAKYHEAIKQVALLQAESDIQKQNSILVCDHAQVVSALGNAVKDLEIQVVDLKEELNQKELEVNMLQESLSAEKASIHEDTITRTTHEQLKASFETEVSLLTAELKEAMKNQDEMSQDIFKARHEVLQVKNEKETIESLVASKDQENGKLKKRSQESEDLISDLKKQLRNFSKLEDDKDKKIEDLTKEVSKLKVALNSLSQLSYTTGPPKRQNQQVDTLQQQVKQLQFQLSEMKKQHQEIVSVYRMHLLYAVQGQMDEDVQNALKQILMMCKMSTQAK
ncbi:ankycorbin-like isoform X2 [Acipenser ruthenus]|uniref:ankycorbin-like isoform X2 n=1 Tax=Acipenser ruthenus TaxID=7906 RepID=UPI0027421807|nr:ankycorbin-like isoform X2 [Acipenser ruthenus]